MNTVRIDPQPVMYVEEACPVCSMKFWVPATVYEWHRRTKNQSMCCPIGHSWVRTTPDDNYQVKPAPNNILRFMEVVTEPAVPIVDEVGYRAKREKVQCDICGKWYVSKLGLKTHKRRSHEVME